MDLCKLVGPADPDGWRSCAIGLGVSGRCRVLVECAACKMNSNISPDERRSKLKIINPPPRAPASHPTRASARAMVTINIGNVLHTNSRASMEAAAARWGADYIEITEPFWTAPEGALPHWGKAQLAPWLDELGYTRAVYFDADILIRSDCPSLFDKVDPGYVGVVSNDQIDGTLWQPGARNRYFTALNWWARRFETDVPPMHEHVNTGVIVFEPKTHGLLFAKWRAAADTVKWRRQVTMIDQAAFSVLLSQLHGEVHGDGERTLLPMQFNTLVYRHDLIRSTGLMQTYVYHFTGNNKERLPSTQWSVPKAVSDITAAPPRATVRHVSSSKLVGAVDPVTVFDRTVCINLLRRPDRMEAFTAGLPDPLPFPPVERVEAVDGRGVPYPSWFPHGTGQWACRQSHLRVLEDALSDGIKSVLVFEDDVEFCPDFDAKFRTFLAAVPDDWEVLFLGGKELPERGRSRSVNEHVDRPGYVILSRAYAVRGKALAALYNHIQTQVPLLAEIDQRLGAYAAQETVASYAPKEWLVRQAEGRSDVTNVDRERRGVT